MKLFEAALRDAAGCFFRHLLTCLTVAPGIGRYIVFAYPLTLLQKFPAVSAEQLGERRIQRSVRGKALHQHHPHGHLKRKDAAVFDDFQIPSEGVEEAQRQNPAEPSVCQRRTRGCRCIVLNGRIKIVFRSAIHQFIADRQPYKPGL